MIHYDIILRHIYIYIYIHKIHVYDPHTYIYHIYIYIIYIIYNIYLHHIHRICRVYYTSYIIHALRVDPDTMSGGTTGRGASGDAATLCLPLSLDGAVIWEGLGGSQG